MCSNQAPLFINTLDDINRALSDALSDKTCSLLLHSVQLGDNFFELRTRLAGELFQKFTNYGARLAMIVPAEHEHGTRFTELMQEHKTHPLIRFFVSEADAARWLYP